jgi:hypothetical protein
MVSAGLPLLPRCDPCLSSRNLSLTRLHLSWAHANDYHPAQLIYGSFTPCLHLIALCCYVAPLQAALTSLPAL